MKEGNPILVQFDLDLDGILTVTATEKATGLQKQLTIDNAMARFRGDNRTAAQERLNTVFAADDQTPTEQPPASAAEPAAEPAEELSPQLRTAVDKANELISQATGLLDNANELDAAEIRELLAQLQAAIDRQSLTDMSDVTAKLDDLVFYLQDAT